MLLSYCLSSLSLLIDFILNRVPVGYPSTQKSKITQHRREQKVHEEKLHAGKVDGNPSSMHVWATRETYSNTRGCHRADTGSASELELIQPHMAQETVLRGEVGCACVAREVSVERGGMGERGSARRLGGWVRV